VTQHDAMLEVRPIDRGHLGAAGSILTDAFWSYEEVTYLLPMESTRRRVLPRYLTADCVDALRFGSLFGAFQEGRLVGVSAWLPPEAYPLSPRREVAGILHVAPVIPWVLPIVPEVLRSQKAKTAGHPHEPHIYLSVLGVRTKTQHTGAGSALVRAMTRQADTLGVGCYLTTATPANVSWYGRFGFDVTEQWRPTPRWPHVWRMWRSVR
jgi:hypothetical protein